MLWSTEYQRHDAEDQVIFALLALMRNEDSEQESAWYKFILRISFSHQTSRISKELLSLFSLNTHGTAPITALRTIRSYSRKHLIERHAEEVLIGLWALFKLSILTIPSPSSINGPWKEEGEEEKEDVKRDRRRRSSSSGRRRRKRRRRRSRRSRMSKRGDVADDRREAIAGVLL